MVTYTHWFPFHGKVIETTVTDEASKAEEWILTVRSTYQEHPTVVVSINCKTKPDPMIIDNSILGSKIANLQLCVGTKCLVLQLLRMKRNTIREFFLEERFVYVGIDIAKTAAMMEKEELGLRIGKKIDVRDLAKVNFPFSYRGGRPGLKGLARDLVALASWKPRNLCPRNLRFEAEVLDQELVKFLSLDAYVVYDIGSHMLMKITV